MDLQLVLDRGGLVLRSDLPGRPADSARRARRAGLRLLLPGVWVARSQPVGVSLLTAALREADDARLVVVGAAALWLHGAGAEPAVLQVGAPHATRFAAHPPIEVVRISPSVLVGCRTLKGVRVVALETAVVQTCADLAESEARRLLESVLRSRHTTVARLRATLRRGLKGSAVVRRALAQLTTSLDRHVRLLVAELRGRGVLGLRTEVRFTSAAGAICWADLLHEPSGTVMEVDGYLTHAQRDRFKADRRRDRWLVVEQGVTTLRIDAQELETDLTGIADEIAPMLLAAQWALT